MIYSCTSNPSPAVTLKRIPFPSSALDPENLGIPPARPNLRMPYREVERNRKHGKVAPEYAAGREYPSLYLDISSCLLQKECRSQQFWLPASTHEAPQ